MKIIVMPVLLALGLAAFGTGCCSASPPNGQCPAHEKHMGGPGGPERGEPRPASPLMAALDVNHDGIIDSNEIANASAALKTLDKNGDGQLTPDELRPVRPQPKDGPECGGDKPAGPPPGHP
jgi:hypothetical protein